MRRTNEVSIVTRNSTNGVEGPSARSKPPRRSAEQRRAGAERMRLHRERKRRGLSCITVEIRNAEIASLIRSGYLPRERSRERRALVAALHLFLDTNLK
jgi:hypothetical protein